MLILKIYTSYVSKCRDVYRKKRWHKILEITCFGFLDVIYFLELLFQTCEIGQTTSQTTLLLQTLSRFTIYFQQLI